SLESFLNLAQREGEIGPTEDLRELAEYMFVTNIGEAVFVARARSLFRTGGKLRFVRRTLQSVGVKHVDELIDEVLPVKTDWMFRQVPRCSGSNCPLQAPSGT